jgi:hypothetical protein
MISEPCGNRQSEWVRARRRLRDELRRIRASASPLLAAHAAVLRLEPWRDLLGDWEDVVGRIIDAADEPSSEQPRWPGDIRTARRPGAFELGRWMDDVA